MPKKPVKTRNINSEVFREVIAKKGFSVRKLGADKNITPSERTIRRQLILGRMRPDYIEEIAKYINVDSRILTGEKVCFKEYINRYPLDHLEEYPYFREERDKYRLASVREGLSRILSLFNRSYEQFEQKEYEEQYLFEKELYDAMYSVVRKHFKVDGFGNSDEIEAQRVFYLLETEHDEHDELLYADTKLREKFLLNLPSGYTKEQILQMKPYELIELDAFKDYEPLEYEGIGELFHNSMKNGNYSS